MGILANFDVLSVGVATAASFILGFLVFFSDKNNTSSRLFLFFSLVTGVWGIFNFFGYRIEDTELAFIVLRFVMFLAVWQAYTLFDFSYYFTQSVFISVFIRRKVLIPLTIITSLISLTPLVLKSVSSVSESGIILSINNGVAIPLFGFVSVGFVMFSLFLFVKKIFSKIENNERSNYVIVFIGLFLMFLSIIIFNFIFPAVFNNSYYLQFGELFTFPFILLTSYSIYRYKLFNTKLAYIGFISFILTMFSFFNIIYAQSAGQIILNLTFFTFILAGSIILIKTILREVEQKEKLQQLNDDLKELVVQRENLVHLISHKVKGSFTHSKYIFSEILEGTFGSFSEKIGEIVKKGLDSDKEGIKTIDMVLNSFNLQQGKIKFDFQALDLAKITQEVIDSKNLSAQSKNISLVFEKEEGDFYVMGDAIWLKEVIGNLISNAIIYTQEGEVYVFLKRVSRKIILSVKDSGIGISKEDRSRLFTEGGRGKDSIKYNTDSTGYGLYTVKLVITAHKGFVWAESAGEGQGSKFYIELPSL